MSTDLTSTAGPLFITAVLARNLTRILGDADSRYQGSAFVNTFSFAGNTRAIFNVLNVHVEALEGSFHRRGGAMLHAPESRIVFCAEI